MAKPTLSIEAVTEIAPTTVKAHGTIINTGGVNANKRGFVYSLTSHADPGDVQPGASGYKFYAQDKGSFSFTPFDIELSSLSKATKFYIRSFAHNPSGYSYSGEIDFTTLANIYPDSIYSPRVKINKDDVNYDSAQLTKLYSPDITKLDDEVVSIETELGLNPKGIYDSVAANLSALWSAISGFVSSFLELSDTPDSYADSGGKVVAVKNDLSGLEFITAAGGVKCTGAEIDIGTDDDKFATSKAIRDSGLLNGVVAGELAAMTAFTALVDADVFLLESSANSNNKYKTLWSNIKAVLKTYFDGIYAIGTIPVKATGAEINTGTDDAKFATPKAIADSDIAFLSNIPTILPANIQEFVNVGAVNWVKPTGVTAVRVILVGGGGGGGGGCGGNAGTYRGGGGGGGGGSIVIKDFKASDLADTVSVTIPTQSVGGNGGNGVAGAVGTAGGNTTFGSYLTSYGGGRGYGGQVATASSGGGGAGSAGKGNDGSTAKVNGGVPLLAGVDNGISGAGGAGQTGNPGSSAEYGGGGGNGHSSGDTNYREGGSSIFGAAGGGAGASGKTDNTAVSGGYGGSVKTYSSGNGGAGRSGTVGTAGGDGASGDSTKCGQGGGGGGFNAAGTGGVGGAGGNVGGGGGGGAGGTVLGGAGGAGGKGYALVISW